MTLSITALIAIILGSVVAGGGGVFLLSPKDHSPEAITATSQAISVSTWSSHAILLNSSATIVPMG